LVKEVNSKFYIVGLGFYLKVTFNGNSETLPEENWGSIDWASVRGEVTKLRQGIFHTSKDLAGASPSEKPALAK